MVRQAKQFYEFGPFRIDAGERQLLRDNLVVSLTPKVFDTLLVLVENSGHILTKDEVMTSVWAETAVEEANLTKNISTLRKALGESPGQHQFIETIPWRGYRFVAGVREVGYQDADLILEERTRSHVLIEEETSEQTVEESLEPASVQKSSAPDIEVKRRSRTSLSVLAVSAALVIAVIAAILLLTTSRNPAPAAPVISSVAVLPLENLSGDPAQEYFADGMTEALINNLARIRALRVISRASVMRFKGTNKSLPEIARELNVDAVITGSVQRSGGRVRVTAQLIHAATDAHLWARDYDRELTDVLKLESEIARAVADEVRIQLPAEERERLASTRSVNPQAHEAYLLGRFHFNKGNEQGWKKAIEYFERAIELDPDHAAAYAGLSDAWLFRGVFGTADFRESESPARGSALKAIALDEQLAEAHIALGNIKQHYDWDWAGAEKEIRRALELDPGSFDAHINYGYLLMHLGRHDEAIREGQIALQLDPLSSVTHSALGRVYYRARRYEEALPHLERGVELEPRSIAANFRLGDEYAQLGRYDEAIAAFEKIREVMPQGGDFQGGIARVYALMGRHREARQMVIQSKAGALDRAIVYAALGDKDEAFRILEKAVEEHQFITVLKVEPPLENLHSDPRWKVLLRRMKFPTND